MLNNNTNQARFRFNQFKETYEKAYGEALQFTFEEFMKCEL